MTDEEARKVLQEQIDKYGQEYDAEGIEALDMAIKALERQKKILSYIDRLLNQGTGKKKSLEFLKKYILEGEKDDE